jgi:hypothetical protein
MATQDPRYFLCGFQEKMKPPRGISAVVWKYCNIDDWHDKKWVMSASPDDYSGYWLAETTCPEGFYGAKLEIKSDGATWDDDLGMTAIKLLCYDRYWQWWSYATNKYNKQSCEGMNVY